MSMELRKRLASAPWTASVLFALGSAVAWASVPVEGTLQATKDCEAFVSKKKKSNPDKARLEPGDAYVLLEQNRPNQPQWFRVRVDDANPPERWVEASCGTLTMSGRPDVPTPPEPRPPRPDDPSLCRTAGLQDSFKLALSWQPAFCESHRGKKECAANFPATFQSAGNFTLHGLWPNREQCGTNYGNCENPSPQREFCSYPALNINPEVAKQLSEVMPGTASCLERHEWFKHGTCQVDWDTSEYFEVAINLVRQFNDSGMNKFMAENMGKEVSREDFLKQVDTSLGAGARERLELGCTGGNLTDVFVNLPAQVEPGESLTELIKTAPPDFRSRCPARFKIDAVGFGR
jgi:ribonuclease T2